MKNAELLESLAAAARKEDPSRDPTLAALLEGSLSAEEIAALEEEAGRSERAKQFFEAYRPLDAATRARIEAQVLSRIAPSETSVDETPIDNAPPPRLASTSSTSSTSSTPIPKPPRSTSGSSFPPRLIALLGGVMLALALWFFIGRDNKASLPPTAQWVMTIEAEQSQRGSALPGELPHLGPSSTFTAVLHPEVRVEVPLAAQAYLLRDGRPRAWEVPIELGSDGAARITGTKEALFPGIRAGRWEVLVIVGLPGTLPDMEQVRALGALSAEQRAAQKVPYRVYGQEIELRDNHDP
ncbi:MAG: hypothetical protein ABI193_23090 [Minicystis sp.]